MDILDVRKSEFEIFRYSFLKDNFSNVYLIFGPKYSGKKTFSKEVSQAILCDKNNTEKKLEKPCRICKSCKSFDLGANENFFFFGKNEAESIGLSKDSIKFFSEGIDIITKTSLKTDKKNIFVIPEVENLSGDAVSYLLKTLDDANKNTIFFLTSNKISKVLKTIVSRSFIIRFNQIPKNRFLDVFSLYKLERNDQDKLYFRFMGLDGRAIKNFSKSDINGFFRSESEALSKSDEKISEIISKENTSSDNHREKAVKLVEQVIDFLSFEMKFSDDASKINFLDKIENTLLSLENIQKNGNIKINLDFVFLNLTWSTN